MLLKFLDKIKENFSLSNNNKVICFQSDSYPTLFFSILLNTLKKNQDIKFINLTEESESQIKSKLEQSFLGNITLYWLGGISQSIDKWSVYLKNYKGPNKIAFFIEKKKNFNGISIEFNDKINRLDFETLSNFFDFKKTASFEKKLFKKAENISLDLACLLVYYNLFLGIKDDLFFDQWISRLLPIDIVFFKLAQYFYTKNIKMFFSTLEPIKEQFSDAFWIAFWSEQLWQGFNFIKLSSKKKSVEANKFGYRLPYSFKQKNWRDYSLLEIRNAHDFLYKVDFNFKNTSSEFSLDVFYLKFFLNQFEN